MSTMSSATTATRGLSRQSWTGDLLATLKRWCVAYITWRIERAAIAQLCLMSDRELSRAIADFTRDAPSAEAVSSLGRRIRRRGFERVQD